MSIVKRSDPSSHVQKLDMTRQYPRGNVIIIYVKVTLDVDSEHYQVLK